MARPHIEFIQSQRLPWSTPALDRAGVRSKCLSVDDETGAATHLLRYQQGSRSSGPRYLTAAEEIFVVSGALTINGERLGTHHYAYLPAGHVVEWVAEEEADVLTMFSGMPKGHRPPVPDALFEPELLIANLDPLSLAWDQSGQDPKLQDLLIWRKILRLDPRGQCRTFLLAGLPHGIHPAGKKQLEYHTYCEEMFLLSGELACHCGLMQAGAYFWRPPQKIHGLESSRNGFLALIRIPGSNENVCNWVHEGPVSFTPAYNPILPDELLAYRGSGPLERPSF